MTPTDSPQSRANALWKRFVGMFGGDAVERKFGLTPPDEWVAMMGQLNQFELQRGLRRLAFGGKAHVPTLPEFTKLCRAIGDATIEEGPQRVALPAPESRGAFDGWAISANMRFWKYITHRLMDSGAHRPWGAPSSAEHAECTRIAVRYKNAWAQDMRESEVMDTATGEVIRLSDEEQANQFASCMERAEADIAIYRAGMAA